MNTARISQLSVYPIKSCTGLHLNHALVEEHGLAFDRRFVVATPEGKFLTARTHPRLNQIHCALVQDGLHLRAPDMPPLDVEYQHFSARYTQVQVWSSTIDAQHCSSDYDQWFSDYLGVDCQLLFFGKHSERKVKRRDSQVAFADGYPLLLISQASLDDLNQRASDHIRMSQFRPNIVVKGTEPFAEDNWKRIRIGEVEFEITKPCSRCVFTTLDPETGQYNELNEPLRTLANYRKGADGELYFGQNMVALNKGKISLYDPIEVLETQQGEAYPDHAPKRPGAQPPSSGLWQSGQQRLECVAVEPVTHDVSRILLALPDGLRCHYLAGQYLPIEVEIDGHPVHRNYTLSSSPSRQGLLELTIKRVEGGKVSNWLLDNIQAGMHLKALPPAGDFYLECASQPQLLLLSAGSGITPMLSMLRNIVDQRLPYQVIFLHSAHSEQDLINRAELDYLNTFDNIDIRYTLSREAPSDWQGYTGRLNRGMLLDVAELEQHSVFACGPQAFMQSAKEQLLALGLHESDYFEESFGHRDEQAASDAPATAHNILFDSWDSYVQGNDQQTLLEQAEDAGINLPYSCRGGFCGACRVKLESGEVKVIEDSGLSEQDKQDGFVLACSCKPRSDLVITQG